ncbi:P7 procapsid protein [Pseudomonas phage phi13]|uniref:p7 n=1 Tax=Pseudomonas phage phi13 TaxID=134554 RepID=Q9FZT3_9VIRU|nr:P7 procapsid protein [Pseudomonas phage phi13]AAG00443.1 P7 [Pseudomonas phage phi13]
MLKLIPPFTDSKPAVLDTIDRSGATFVEVDKLYKLWPHVATGAIVIASITTEELALLQRFMSSLLQDVPTVITAVPGCFYSSEWNMLAAHLHSVPYSDLESQLLKSGFLSHTPAQAEARGAQIVGAAPATGRGFLSRTPAAPAEDDDDAPITGAEV